MYVRGTFLLLCLFGCIITVIDRFGFSYIRSRKAACLVVLFDDFEHTSVLPVSYSDDWFCWWKPTSFCFPSLFYNIGVLFAAPRNVLFCPRAQRANTKQPPPPLNSPSSCITLSNNEATNCKGAGVRLGGEHEHGHRYGVGNSVSFIDDALLLVRSAYYSMYRPPNQDNSRSKRLQRTNPSSSMAQRNSIAFKRNQGRPPEKRRYPISQDSRLI